MACAYAAVLSLPALHAQCTRTFALMGLCLSVALWKEKDYAAAGRPVQRGADEVAGGGCEYGSLQQVEEAVVVAEAAAADVKSGAQGVGAATAGGTPARPIWQRRVLMGVKCQMPRFSGMILYDERGRPVCSGIRDKARDQEKHAAAISVLRDML